MVMVPSVPAHERCTTTPTCSSSNSPFTTFTGPVGVAVLEVLGGTSVELPSPVQAVAAMITAASATRTERFRGPTERG